MDRIVDLDCATMTVHRTTLWIKKSGTKRCIHALPHSHQKKGWVDGNVDKLAVTVYGREQRITALVSGLDDITVCMSLTICLGDRKSTVLCSASHSCSQPTSRVLAGPSFT
jgi:hypothetical protein